MDRQRRRADRGQQGDGGRTAAGTRTRILEASLELFAERGFEGTGISEIAERVGIAKSVIYHHFRDKDAVLAEISHRTIAEAMLLKGNLTERFAQLRGGSRDLSGIVEPLVSFVLERRSAMVVLLRESLRGGPNPPLFEFWESNLRAGAEMARRSGIDLTGARGREALLEAFFMLVLPIVSFAVLGDQWAGRFGLEPRQARKMFERAFRVNLEELWLTRRSAVSRGTKGRRK